MIKYLFLILVVFIGAVVSYEDYKFGKIKNKWILFGLLFGLMLYSFSFIGNLLSGTYFFVLLINTSVSLLVGYLFWYFDWWSAGDAKLFMIFAFLIPEEFYSRATLPYFLSFATLVNAFFLFLFFISVQSLFYLGKKIFNKIKEEKLKQKKYKIALIGVLKQIFLKLRKELKNNIIKYLKNIFLVLLLFFLLQLIKKEFNYYFYLLGWNQLILFIFAILTGFGLRKIFQNNMVLFFLSSSLVLLLIYASPFPDYKSIVGLFLTRNLFYYIIIILLANWLTYFIKNIENKTLRFAPWLFAGAIVTIFFKGSLLHILWEYIGR